MKGFKHNRNLRFNDNFLTLDQIGKEESNQINEILLSVKGDNLGEVKIYHVVEEGEEVLKAYKYLEVYEDGVQLTKIITDYEMLNIEYVETIPLGKL